MFWFRLVLVILPAAIFAAGYLALGKVARPRLKEVDGSLLAVYHGEPIEIDLLRGSDALTVGIRDLVLEPLIRLEDGGRIAPGIAATWREGQTLAYSLPDEDSATAAQKLLEELDETRRTGLGLEESEAVGSELVVRLAPPSSTAGDEILELLGELAPLSLHHVRVDLTVEGAAEYHRRFLDRAVEGGQVRKVWFDGEFSYEMWVAGEIGKFLEELWIYYGEGSETVDNIGVLGRDGFLNEPWVSFGLGFDEIWHDGTPVTAADVLFTLETLRRLPPGQPLARMTREILRAESEDERTVRVTYRRPYSPGLAVWAGVRVLPSHYLGDPVPDLWPATAGVEIPGSGDVHVISGDEGRFVLLLADGVEGAFPKGGRAIRFVPAPPRLELVASRRMGEIDIIFPRDRDITEIAEEPRANLVQAGSGQWEMLAFNLDRSLFGAAGTRRALSLAVDSQGLIDDLLSGHGKLVRSLLAPEIGLGVPELEFRHDREAAAELLAAQGWKRGEEDLLVRQGRSFSLEVIANEEDPFRRNLAERIAEGWRELGIQVDLVFLPWQKMVQRTLVGRDFDVALIGWSPDATWDIEHLWHSESLPPAGANFVGFKDPEVDRLVRALRVEYDAERRSELAKALQERIVEAAPVLPLFERKTSFVIFDSAREAPKDAGSWSEFFNPEQPGGGG